MKNKLISIYKLIAYSIDFEGSISISKHIKNTNIPCYSVSITIDNTSKELLEAFKKDVNFGKVNGPYYKNIKKCMFGFQVEMK